MNSFENVFILIGGANASGKSSIIKPKYVAGRVKYHFDPDRFEDDPNFAPITDSNILTLKALKYRERGLPDRFAIECIDNLLKPENEHIRREGFSTESNIVSDRDSRIFEKAKECGMRTEFIFVYVSQEASIQQEEIRADKGDQKRIGKTNVEKRYRGLFNIHNLIDEGNIDVFKIYDNSHDKGNEQLVLHIENNKTFYLHHELLEQRWFKDANIKLPPLEISCEKGIVVNNARDNMGDNSFVVSARPGIYEGEIIEKSSHYAVQKTSQGIGILHELDNVPGLRDYDIGEQVTIKYDRAGSAEISNKTIDFGISIENDNGSER